MADPKDKKRDKSDAQPKPAASGGGGGGKWLLILAVLGLLVGWWIIYQPFRPDSKLLPPTAGVTNRVPEALTNLATSVQQLTNYIPSNILSLPWPGGSKTGDVAKARSATNAMTLSTNAPLRVGGETNEVARSVLTTNPPVRTSGDLRLPQNAFEVQLALDRQGISPGSLDGVMGSQTRAAIRAFQKREGLPATGEADAATRSRLWLRPPVFVNYTVTAADLARLRPVSDTWLGKSQQDRLDYSTILELVAEKGHAHPDYIRRINPSFDWTNVTEGASITIPNSPALPATRKAAFVRIRLSEKTLQAFDPNGHLLAHFPCSIARFVEKRPVGQLRVTDKAAENPNYRFDPKMFPESAEARRMEKPLMIQPGPNNPVGLAWIGLDRPGYGIHGTPAPEAVGRTESHGCFRLANWNAQLLLKLVWKDMPVQVEP